MEYFFSLTIIILGAINAIRMAGYFILGDIYDAVHQYKMSKITHSKEPLLSVLIAAHNEELVIGRCLDSILKNHYPHVQIIVIDDGSTDRTSKVVREYKRRYHLKNLTLVIQKNQGKAAALNNALRNTAKGSLVMSLDADSVLAPDAFANAVKYFEDPAVIASAGNVRIFWSPTLLGLIQVIEYLLGYRLKKAFSILNNEYIIGGIGAVFRRSAIESVGFYDTDTLTEDIDLTMKLAIKGNRNQKIIYAPDVLCWTESVMSLEGLFRQRFRWKFGRFQTLVKHRSMFFNSDKIYTKRLTWLQLPFVLFSELTFLFDPIFICYLLYLSYHYQETSSIQGVFFFLAFYTIATIISDQYLTSIQKASLILVAPLAYIFFFVVSIVEYVGLIKCLIKSDEILHPSKQKVFKWEHVARAG